MPRITKYKYEGHLQDYYETGMECLGLILQDNRGIHDNPNYDPTATEWPKNMKEFYSLSYSLFFNDGDEIEVYRADGTVEFRGTLTKDRNAMIKNKFQYAFLPKEVDKDTWVSWFMEQRKAKAWSKKSPSGKV